MKWILMFAALLAGTAQAEVWTCEMQPRVLGEPRHGETVTHTFTKLPRHESGYVAVMENFTTDFEYTEEWWVIYENEHLSNLIMPDSREDEVQHAALFKKDRRAVKTLMLSDIAVVMADQGFCEITDTAKEG
ncbi:hypothetical protein N9M28_04955, partial [Luminiphilus sp.]|nr:hypothetical protein [Luminiphilus sp.]